MTGARHRALSATLLAVAIALASATGVGASDPIDFERDIQPILKNNCFECHGPDMKAR